MNLYNFKIYGENWEKVVCVMGDDTNNAIDNLFNRYEFNNYQLIGLRSY